MTERMTTRFRALIATIACGLATIASAQTTPANYVGRPIYSEPGSGLQLPPGCAVEPSWRSKLGSSDLEVWVVNCNGTAHGWLLRRSVVEVLAGNQARLRFQVLDERAWSGETAGDTASVRDCRHRRRSGHAAVQGS